MEIRQSLSLNGSNLSSNIAFQFCQRMWIILHFYSSVNSMNNGVRLIKATFGICFFEKQGGEFPNTKIYFLIVCVPA